MCHGLPHQFPCGHTSVTWHYCPSAHIDLETGFSSPCDKVTFAATQSSSNNCPLGTCDFRNAAGNVWKCCQCDRTNTTGWCAGLAKKPSWQFNAVLKEWQWIDTCDHGCCVGCEKDAPTPIETGKKSKTGRSSKARRANSLTPAASTTSDSTNGASVEHGQQSTAPLEARASSSKDKVSMSLSKSTGDKSSTSSSRKEHKHRARSGH